jgi:hypothetical protein
MSSTSSNAWFDANASDSVTTISPNSSPNITTTSPQMTPTVSMLVSVYFGAVMLFANGVTIAALTRCKLMLLQMKYLIISLASADLLLGCFMILEMIRSGYFSLANLPLPLCQLRVHFGTFREYVTCFTVVAIAVDRVIVLRYIVTIATTADTRYT